MKNRKRATQREHKIFCKILDCRLKIINLSEKLTEEELKNKTEPDGWAQCFVLDGLLSARSSIICKSEIPEAERARKEVDKSILDVLAKIEDIIKNSR